MSIATSFGRGRYHAGDTDVVLTPRLLQPGQRGVVYCHGADRYALSDLLDPMAPGFARLLRGVAEHFPMVSADLGGPQTWGNATVQARIDEARQYLGEVTGADVDEVFLLGASMGSIASLNYAFNFLANVRAVCSVLPLPDMDFLYQTDVNGARAFIAAAWGITYPAPLPSGSNPIDNTATLDGLPYQAWFANNDELQPPENVIDFANAIGGVATNLGDLGHMDALVGKVPVIEVVQFFQDHDG